MRALFENLGWKLLALGIAVVLWATFVGSPELVTSISAPLEFQNMPRELELSSGLPERVYVEVRGPSARLHSEDLSRVAVVLNLSGINRTGAHTLTIERNTVDLPVGVGLVRVVPSQVRLDFEHRVWREVPIRLRFAAPPPAGFRLARQEVRPKVLRIVGPESRVNAVAYAETDPIDLTRIDGTSKLRVHTFIADPQVRLISSPVVQVELSLEKHGPATVRH